MARAAALDDLAADVTLASGVSASGTTATLSADPGSTNWPTGSGVFSVLVGDTASAGTFEVVDCTRTGTTLTLAAPRSAFTLSHSAGDPVTYIESKEDLNNKASLDADNTFTGGVIVNGDVQLASNQILSSVSGSSVSLIADYLSLTANASLYIGGIVTFIGYNLFPNEGAAFGPTISGGEILYGHLGTLYFLDGGASNRNVYLNYDTLGCGLSIIVNTGATNSITVDEDPAGTFTMTASTIPAGSFRTFAGNSAQGDYNIYRIG